MQIKTNVRGEKVFYFVVRRCDEGPGCPVRSETLGTDFEAARARATFLNSHLQSWRDGRPLDDDPVPAEKSNRITTGSIDWWVTAFVATDAYHGLSPVSQKDYRRVLEKIADIPAKIVRCDGAYRRLGELPCSSLTPSAADKIYEQLRAGGRVTRQANLAIDVARKAWKEISRAHPGHMFVIMPTPDGTRPVALNPFQGVRRVHSRGTTLPANREEAFALADALKSMGHPALGLVAVVAFELHQRPENIIAGHLLWSQYRPKDRPGEIEIFHHKTGERVWHELETRDAEGRLVMLYPELEEWIRSTEKLGPQMVMFRPQRGPRDGSGLRIARLYSESHVDHLVQKARKLAGLPNHVTLAACRHGGMTLLGDAGITEAGIMSLSGHLTPDAARIYVKRTDKQRVSAALKRRQYLDAEAKKTGAK